MEDITQVLALFDSAEKWKAFIDLSKMKENLIIELKNRLCKAWERVVSPLLKDSGWVYSCDRNHIGIKPEGNELIRVIIEWIQWDFHWGKQSVFIYVKGDEVDSKRVFNQIKDKQVSLPMKDYAENFVNSQWLLFAKQIPSRVFGGNSPVSVEECLFMAKDNAEQLAINLWNEVFQPFAKKETAKIFRDIIDSKN